ncbi:hypothetical protein O3G_MSEX007708 [Manduca sexta]|uniref:Uncharacterized protein n=3 Tax=Manduca sexta TaxID=7130 RepID=A0A922CP52_MANSE|nr:hypothetical protein O3G_MSEX007708 [Manduca sexta]
MAKNDLEMKMLYLVDKWRTGDLDALPYPMPPLDEWRMPPFEGKYNGLGLQMTFSTTGMLITGLNNFTITEMNISEENLEGSAVLNYPFVNMEADNYKLNGRAYVVYKLRGSGRMNVRVRNTKLVFGFRVNNNGSKPVVDDLQLDYEIESLEVDLENSSWPINKILNTEGLKIMNKHHDNIITQTRTNMIEFINEFLLEMPPERFFAIMETVNCSCLEGTTITPLE